MAAHDTSSIIVPNARATELRDWTPKPTALTDGLTEASVTTWASASDGAEAGIWGCDVGSFTAVRDGYTEICQFLAGTATIEPEGEAPFEVREGDTLVMPSGWRGTWHVHEPIRKVFITIDDRKGA